MECVVREWVEWGDSDYRGDQEDSLNWEYLKDQCPGETGTPGHII